MRTRICRLLARLIYRLACRAAYHHFDRAVAITRRRYDDACATIVDADYRARSDAALDTYMVAYNAAALARLDALSAAYIIYMVTLDDCGVLTR